MKDPDKINLVTYDLTIEHVEILKCRKNVQKSSGDLQICIYKIKYIV